MRNRVSEDKRINDYYKITSLTKKISEIPNKQKKLTVLISCGLIAVSSSAQTVRKTNISID